MTRHQYRLLCLAKSRLRNARQKAKRLKKINQNPKLQYDWDLWVKTEGYIMGLECGLNILETFIRAGKNL